MAKSHNNFKPRRSRRSGLKKAAFIKKNLEVLKKLSVGVLVLFMMMGCTTTKYVMVDPKDSTRLVEVRKRIVYDDYYMSVPPASLYNNYWWWYNTRPIMMQVPMRGPNFGPLPPTPKPHR